MRIAWIGAGDSFLVKGLREAGHQVETADTDALAEEDARRAARFEALAFDRPRVTVDEIAAAARALPDALRIVLIDADQSGQIAELLRAGADVCLVRPVSGLELQARLDAHTRKAPRPDLRLQLRPELRSAEIDGRAVELTPKEYAILEALAARPGEVLAASDLIRLAWGPDAEQDPRAVAAHVARLRAKLGVEPRIVSLRGHGYRLDFA